MFIMYASQYVLYTLVYKTYCLPLNLARVLTTVSAYFTAAIEGTKH